MTDLSLRPRSALASPARVVLRAMREAPLWPLVSAVRLRQGRGPVAVFLPATGREQVALLRIYYIADALRPLGWQTIVLPHTLTLAQRHRLLGAARPDVVVMQGARHALNRPALYPGYRIVYDMDDADFHLPHLNGPVRRAMLDVAAVIAGSRYVADWCLSAGAGPCRLDRDACVIGPTPTSCRPPAGRGLGADPADGLCARG